MFDFARRHDPVARRKSAVRSGSSKLTIIRLRHGVLCRAGRRNTGSSASRSFRSRSMSPPNSAIAKPPLPKDGLALFVSQSGETADTLAALRYCKRAGPAHRCRSSTCRRATIARESRCRAADARRARDRRRLHQGVHRQLTVLACLAIAAGRARGALDRGRGAASWCARCWRCRALMADVLRREAADPGARPRVVEGARRAVSRPRAAAFRSRWKAR